MANIKLDDVTVRFPVFTSHGRSARATALSSLGGKIANHDRSVTIEALQNISLELHDGDRLGIVGHNGAGKTTFLRVVAGVYPPVLGTASIEGKVSSFTDITLGMEPESTGWQNILFRCVFLGLTFAEAQSLSPSIAEFSELGPYLHLPVRTYSSGMFLRLAFAISTAVQPDIIVMDEMIGAGDRSFIDKAQRRIENLLERANILVLASHSDSIIRNFCNKALWLDKGRCRLLSDVDHVLEKYSQHVNLSSGEASYPVTSYSPGAE